MDQQLKLTCNTQIKVEPEDKSYEVGYETDLKVKDEISIEEDNLPENFVGIKQELPDNLSIKVEHVDMDYDEGSFEEKEMVPEEMVMKLDPSCYGNDHYNKSGEYYLQTTILLL
ncbi:unnamed protein product [Euphydryas editha]|uniref:Uncharacterized protein n=1 Tax=Euphydryas editha TaxID=104508 RepID=A0AAU9UIN8_EUPED|nr:unnamed protein product [Euphydryas editha]